ncbi:MAG: AMP-dependent synthetase/ligase [Bifidobacteriaceae bacterium]|nr:AMP-dependent synthetase/ligase [Bifidobacteriaceae bacterium]
MLKEYTTPETAHADDDKNVFSILEERSQRAADDVIVEYKNSSGGWSGFTANEFKNKVISIAKGLISKGIKKGDSVSILGHTSWQWTALDIAVMSVGAVTVPIYETNSPAQISQILNDSNVKMIVVEDSSQREKVESVREEVPSLKEILQIDNGAVEQLIQFGQGTEDKEFYSRVSQAHGDDLATIVYTSGSTGVPKGIELTHRSFVFITYSGIRTLPDIALKPNRRLLLFLPLAHVFARYMQFFCIASETSVGLTSGIKTIIQDFQSFKPTFILAVPRVFEKVYNAASQKAGTGLSGRIFLKAAAFARETSKAQQNGEELSYAKKIQYKLYSKAVYSKIMEVFGGNVEYAVSGGAPLDNGISHFFNGIGLPLLEGYGMTETCAPASCNPADGYKIGTVGKPMEGVTVGVDEDGEICIKSKSNCAGYHNNPDITKQQIVDGWLHTGDLGDVDSDGFITLTGRKKDLIITAGGKNVSPSVLEKAVVSSPVIDQCTVVGDRRPFISAIITLDLKETNSWLKAQGAQNVSDLEEAVKNPIVAAEVQRAVDYANSFVSRAESIRKFEIVPDSWTEENGLMTPSMKIKRQPILKKYEDLIEHKIYVPLKKG